MEALMLAVYVHKMNTASEPRSARSRMSFKANRAVLTSVAATIATLGLATGLRL